MVSVKIALRRKRERLRFVFAALLYDIFERGLEMALAGSAIINGRAVLITRPDGTPLAPFLSSALELLSRNAWTWAALLIVTGIVHLLILAASIRSDRVGGRAAMSGLLMLIYSTVTVAVLTGLEPRQAAERYAWSALLSFLCVVVLGGRAVSRHRGKGNLDA